ncbi:unnamed protein product [Adineta steineri]|uniref:Uncharacterized protein n=1 Tax=Adineta steineri TaxID=433720 RepID=A0A818HDK5_9BILA|nr:unnamed protein product [Adineta steineri]
MVPIKKAASDTHLHHQHKSISVLLPLDPNLSRNSNNISSRQKTHNYSFEKSIGDKYEIFLNNSLISTHFPIANIQQDTIVVSKTSSSTQLPTVPKQAGTFIHRLVNKFFSISNTNQNKKNVSRLKRIQHEQTNMNILNTRNISDDSHTYLNISSKKRKRRQQQRSKPMTNNKNCAVCRKYRNHFSTSSINKIQSLPKHSFVCTSQSPVIFNSNATTTQNHQLTLTTESSVTLIKTQLEKKQTSLNRSQCQIIASAVELIFDTLISNYQ